MEYTLDDWWIDLPVIEKERIGSKITNEPCKYPNCTSVWTTLTNTVKQRIHDHCVNKHDDEIKSWQDGKPYSY